MVDSGALHLCIPASVAAQLKLPELEQRVVTVADGRGLTVPYVGPVRVACANRLCPVGALVMGEQALLGAMPMEDKDVLTDPARRTLTVNPASPYIAASVTTDAR